MLPARHTPQGWQMRLAAEAAARTDLYVELSFMVGTTLTPVTPQRCMPASDAMAFSLCSNQHHSMGQGVANAHCAGTIIHRPEVHQGTDHLLRLNPHTAVGRPPLPAAGMTSLAAGHHSYC